MSLTLFIAYFMDECLGEPKRFHPLIGFGNLANQVEQKLYSSKKYWARINGALAWCMVVLPIVIAFYFLLTYLSPVWQLIVNGVVLFLTLGQNSLKKHGLAVFYPLNEGDLQNARYATSMIVSRDTSQSNEQQLATATVETITENTHDAVIAPLFYFVCFGAVGALLFRLANTLDAMWGYRNEKYEDFGKFSARMDDVLGFIPARITAFLFVLVKPSKSLTVFKSVLGNGRKWYSPNAGIVMAAGAGALGIQLGGKAVYHGKEKQRLALGMGTEPRAVDIKRSIRLMYLSSATFVLVVLLGEIAFDQPLGWIL